MHRPLIWASLAAAMAAATTANAQTIIYVDDDAPEGGDGRSWFSAFSDLQDALDAGRFSRQNVVIKIADGVYRPDRGTGDRNASFELSTRDEGVMSGFSLNIRGGFAGLGHPNPDEVNPNEFVSVLSGDLLGNDDLDNETGFEDNSYHVALITDPRRYFVTLDGLTFRSGNADSTENINNPFMGKGGGLVITESLFGTSAYLYHINFEYCMATINGGGIYCDSQNVSLQYCLLEKNYASAGGSIFVDRDADLWVINSIFHKSSAVFGGAIRVEQDALATLTNCHFTENEAWNSGGAINSRGSVLIDGSLLAGNTSDFAGAISIGLGECFIQGTTIAHNVACTANSFGVGPGGTASIIGCVLWSGAESSSEIWMGDDSVLTVQESDVLSGLPGVEGNTDGLIWNRVISEDPLFVDEFGPDNDPMTTDDNNYELTSESPCIDQARSLGPDYLWGFSFYRPWNTNCSCLTAVDMGAYEYIGTNCPPTTSRLYVDLAAPPNGDGLSWSTAMRTIEDALAVPGAEEIWVAQGVYFTPEHDGGLEMSCWWTGLRILGGFNGTETDENERNPIENQTIISGDRLENDIDGSDETRMDNAGAALLVRSALAEIDGFIFRSFDTYWSSAYANFRAQGADVRFTNCIFTNLRAPVIFDPSSSAIELNNCVLSENFGMLFQTQFGDYLRVADCQFLLNESQVGRNLINISSADIENCMFLANSSYYALIDSSQSTNIFGSTFIGNKTIANVSMINMNDTGSITNSAFVANDVVMLSSSWGDRALFTNNLIWDNPRADLNPPENRVQYTLADISIPGPGNIVAADPGVRRFPSSGPDGQWGTPDDDFGDLRPAPYSPLIDAGDSSIVPNDVLFDIIGLPRIVDDQQVLDTGPVSPAVDIGPYESQADSCGGDWNSDSQNNIDDIIAYLSDFDGQRLRADLNRDALWDFYDLQLFLRDFASGCP